MDNIKLRAWFADIKQMIYFDNPIYTKDSQGQHGIFLPAQDNKIYSGTIHIMRFTGIQDANGKNIYEGDIIKYKDYNGTAFHKREVVYSKKYTGFILKSTNYMPNRLEYEAQVIGNIYEHPTLLYK